MPRSSGEDPDPGEEENGTWKLTDREKKDKGSQALRGQRPGISITMNSLEKRALHLLILSANTLLYATNPLTFAHSST